MSAGPRTPDAAQRFARAMCRVLLAWLALIALLLGSWGSAYLSLGALNSALSIGIAVVKSMLVVWLFMQLRVASGLVRLAAVAGLVMLLLLSGLTGVDYATRESAPATVETPAQLQAPLEERNFK